MLIDGINTGTIDYVNGSVTADDLAAGLLDSKADASHLHVEGDITGLATTLAGKSDTGHGHNTADVTGLDTALSNKLETTLKGAINGLAELDASGKIPSAQVPAIAITSTSVVANEGAMLALTAQTGDVAVRSDLNKSFILRGSNPALLADWEELQTPTDAVQSVGGNTGVVTAAQLLTAIKTVDGAGSGLDADTIDGWGATASESPNTIVQRDANGYIHNSYFNMSADTTAVTASKIAIETSSDGYLRWQTPAQFIANHNIATGAGGLSDAGTSLAQTGYMKLSNGFIIQWGYDATHADNYIYFPVAFTTAVYSVVTTIEHTAANYQSHALRALSTTRFYRDGDGATGTYWMAIGK